MTIEEASVPSADAIIPVPAPWNLKCTVYMIPFWTTAQTAKSLPSKTYHPLEASSSFASPEFGTPIGGLSMIQLIRYTKTPVGPYDELILAPGYFEYPFEDPKNGKKTTRKSLRITRIYVSQKQTTWNGRTNWNIPKHLARFEWDDRPDGTTHIKVFPYDTAVPYDAAEARPADAPWFQCTIRPAAYLPAFPMSTDLFKYLGIDLSLVHPPLPQGSAAQGVLVGTDRWCKIEGITESSKRSKVAWADLDQSGVEGSEEDRYFFPGLTKWNIAVKMEDADVFFPPGEWWDSPKGAE